MSGGRPSQIANRSTSRKYLAFDLPVGRLPSFYNSVDLPSRPVERGARGVEHVPILNAYGFSGSVDLLRHFGG